MSAVSPTLVLDALLRIMPYVLLFTILGRKVVLVVVGEHILFLLKAVSSGLIDKVPKVVREAQLVMAIQQREERKEFRRRASGLPV